VTLVYNDEGFTPGYGDNGLRPSTENARPRNWPNMLSHVYFQSWWDIEVALSD